MLRHTCGGRRSSPARWPLMRATLGVRTCEGSPLGPGASQVMVSKRLTGDRPGAKLRRRAGSDQTQPRFLGVLAVVLAFGLIANGCNSAQVPVSARESRQTVGRVQTYGTRLGTAGPLRRGNYEYVVTVRGVYVYRIGKGFPLVRVYLISQLHAGVRGVAASASTRRLYISYGGDGGSNGHGSLLSFNLMTDKVMWSRRYPFGIDSMDISRSGRRIYMPTGELSSGNAWEVIKARNGAPIARIPGGRGPHNTLVSLDGRYVFLGGRFSRYLDVALTKTKKVVHRIGPLVNTVRPFTVNASNSLVFTTATNFLGFQVSRVRTGRVLYTVRFPGRTPSSPSAPSHGISLSPDGKQLYVIDWPNNEVHVFSVARLPAAAPRQIGIVHLRGSLHGSESPCAYDCPKDGWLLHSRSGRFVFVGDAGDVINTVTRRTVTVLPALTQTRKFIQINWRGGVPIFATSREGVSYGP